MLILFAHYNLIESYSVGGHKNIHTFGSFGYGYALFGIAENRYLNYIVYRFKADFGLTVAVGKYAYSCSFQKCSCVWHRSGRYRVKNRNTEL